MNFTPINANKYHAYILTQNNNIVYWGVDTLPGIFTMTEVKKCPSFNMYQEYVLNIIGIYEHKYQAINRCGEICGKTIPLLNKEYALHKYNKSGAFFCVETGERFYNQSQACQLYKLSQSNLSKHLQGLPGYNSIKGLHFKYITDK